MPLSELSYIDLLVSAVLATIMFGVGLSINTGDLADIYRKPSAFFYGLFAQMILLPLIAFGITFFSDMSPAMKVGFIILAACPGGTTSGFVTVLYRGNVALSVALTTVNSILTLFTIPLLVNLSLTIYMGRHSSFDLPFLQSFLQIFLVTLLPAATGVLLRYRFSALADRIKRPVRDVMIVLFAGVYLLIALADESKGGSGIKWSEANEIFFYALAINIAGFIAGLITGHLGKTGLRSSFTIGIEVALQNTTLALLVGGTIMGSNEMIKPALVYAMFSFWTAMIYGVIIKKVNGMHLFGDFPSKHI